MQKQEQNFSILLEVRQQVIEQCKDGTTAKELYNAALTKLQGKGLGSNFAKNIGFATGLEYRDSAFLLAPKNERKLMTNMVLVISLGLQDLSDKQGS